MAQKLSSPSQAMASRYDVVVVGSGYGGGIAACRMARAGRRVCLLERGAEMHPGDYPNDTLGVLAAVQFDSALLRAGSPAAMFDIRYNPDINVVVGCGLGGTSLINAGIALRPDPAVFASPLWPAELQQAADLDPYVARAEQVLRPAHCPPAMMASAKTASLGRIAAAAGKEAISIPVLVNFEPLPDGLNHAGVAQIPCVGCGDCVTGCNYGAKNTVLMNYLPDAKAHGAEIYTGAQVRRVEKNAAGWTVHGYLPGNENAGAAFAVAADIVILAAGTLGSTEILLRSRDQGLPLSPALGSRFSGNGDTIGFVYNADDAVRGIGLGRHASGSMPQPGPCSTAMVDFRAGHDVRDGMMMADGAVPGGLALLLPALLAIEAHLVGAAARRPFTIGLQKSFREIESKVLGPYRGAVRNSLFMLLIAHDDSAGRMSLVDDRLRIAWPGIGDQPQFARASDTMRQAATALGGTYVQNPIWNRLTDHNLITGHPLGGCPMADDAERGVVNHRGQVFSAGNGRCVHDGLYVMDGSVVPTSLGVNPLLTISALAERSCSLLGE